MLRTVSSAFAFATALSIAAGAASAQGIHVDVGQGAGQRSLILVAERPQVRNSSKAGTPDRPKVRAKRASEVSKVICEGGQVKTASSGFVGCYCGPNVRRVTVGKSHFRCDRPQVRDSATTSKDLPGKQGPRAKHASEVNKQPGSKGKPIQKQTSTGKPVSECKAMLTATRRGATTRGFGLATAVAAWERGAKELQGYHMGKWKYARDKTSNCSKAALLWKCTVSARPCPPS